MLPVILILVNNKDYKPQSRFARFWLVASVSCCTCESKSTVQHPRASQSGTSHWVSWHHAYINLLTVFTHAQQLQCDIHRRSTI